MAISITEDVLSRSFTFGLNAQARRVYNVTGESDETVVYAQLLIAIPPVYFGLELESVDVEPIGVDTVTDQGVWKATAQYRRFENDDEFTFDTGGGSTKITNSLGTVASYTAGILPAPDFGGAIGVTDDRVEGVDITIPNYQWTETHRFTDAQVDNAYKQTLFGLTGTWNDDTFKGFASGQVLLMGVNGSKRGDEKWSITFRFACSPNITGATIGTITGINKLGWDYLWVRYEDYDDPSSFTIVKRPIDVYVERVYEPGDFSGLNIGT